MKTNKKTAGTLTTKSHEELIEKLRGCKKELQQARFRLTPETQAKTSRHKELRKEIARISTELVAKKKASLKV